MDNEKNNQNKLEVLDEQKNYIEILKEAQEKMPGIVIPSMGMIDNEFQIEIDGKDYIKK